jgi:hypothetical protein
LVGLLAKHSPNVRTALRSIVTYEHLHVQGAMKTLDETGRLATFSYVICEPDAEATDQLVPIINRAHVAARRLIAKG